MAAEAGLGIVTLRAVAAEAEAAEQALGAVQQPRLAQPEALHFQLPHLLHLTQMTGGQVAGTGPLQLPLRAAHHISAAALAAALA
tara:strand:- start:1533 stop:1787 length:255 start_codon:yes stop_codon:yes gene_type:complete